MVPALCLDGHEFNHDLSCKEYSRRLWQAGGKIRRRRCENILRAPRIGTWRIGDFPGWVVAGVLVRAFLISTKDFSEVVKPARGYDATNGVLRACLKTLPGRRMRARGLQDFRQNLPCCRLGALRTLGRGFSKQLLGVLRLLAGLALTLALLSPAKVLSQDQGFDWPQFLGPSANGVSTERGLLDKWPTGGPP